MESIDICSVNLSKLDTEHTEIFFSQREILKLGFALAFWTFFGLCATFLFFFLKL